MIQISPNTKIYVATAPVDFRMGIDGLGGVCKYTLNLDPFSGAMFVFASKNKKSVKLLYYDGQGFWLCQKRLSRGKFNWWPDGEICAVIAAKDLSVLLWNGTPNGLNFQSDWRPIMT